MTQMAVDIRTYVMGAGIVRPLWCALFRVAQHEHINKMGPGNLAIIFAPCLLRKRTVSNPSDLLRDIDKQTR